MVTLHSPTHFQWLTSAYWCQSNHSDLCGIDVVAGSCMQSETGDAYTGGAYVTTSGLICQPWSLHSCQVCGIFFYLSTI